LKCRRCRGQAVIELRRHNSSFCKDCFFDYLTNQVTLAQEKQKMFSREDRVLVVVSGGKDSLALWEILLGLGVNAWGLHINLGIDEYSQKSEKSVRNFAENYDAELLITNIKDEHGRGVLDIASKTTRTACSACGLIKRYLFNKVALEKGFSVVATGHNLDDEAASLLGNVLHWKEGFLGRQSPVLPSVHPKLARKVKPLFRLTERETAAYCILKGIDYLKEECPLVKGSTSLHYKEALNLLEQKSPGTKHSLYFGFLKKRAVFEPPQLNLKECLRCGQATTDETCAFCRLLSEVESKTRVSKERIC